MNWILVRDPKIGAEPGSIDVAEDTDTITLGTETFKRVAVGWKRGETSSERVPVTVGAKTDISQDDLHAILAKEGIHLPPSED